MTRPRTALTLATAGLALVVTGCGTSAPSASRPATASTTAPTTADGGLIRVTVANFAYAPKAITVSRGAKITWINRDSTPHTATSGNPAFDTGPINPGASGSVTLTKPGTYQYICSFHPFMHGTVIVR